MYFGNDPVRLFRGHAGKDRQRQAFPGVTIGAWKAIVVDIQMPEAGLAVEGHGVMQPGVDAALVEVAPQPVALRSVHHGNRCQTWSLLTTRGSSSGVSDNSSR